MLGNIQRLVDDWTGGRFFMDSGFYAGRGPTESDLDSQILESFYVGIRASEGAEAAINFVRFVNNLEDLSASSFIVAFERFCARGCKETTIAQRTEDRDRITDRGDAGEAQAFAVFASLFGERRSPEQIKILSGRIKYDFIRRHVKEIPADEQRATQNPYFR